MTEQACIRVSNWCFVIVLITAEMFDVFDVFPHLHWLLGTTAILVTSYAVISRLLTDRAQLNLLTIPGSYDRISSMAAFDHQFSHANTVLKPIRRFKIGNRWLELYSNTGYTPSSSYVLYWSDENNPAQHNMNDLEVFAFLADVLNV